MISELLELQKTLLQVEDLKLKFRKHLPDAHALVREYVEHTTEYIERGLGDITYVTNDEVTFVHYCYEYTASISVPLELFTNQSFLKELIDKKREEDAIKKNKLDKEIEKNLRFEYERLKKRFGE